MCIRDSINTIKTKFKSWYLYNSKSINKKVVSDCTSGFRAIRNTKWQKLNLMSNGFQIETEMLYEIRKIRLMLTEVPISCKWDGHYSSLSISKDGVRTLKLLARKLVNDFRTM